MQDLGQWQGEGGSQSHSRQSSPAQSTKVQQIDRSDPHSEVFSWGCDAAGQLGLGDIHG